MYMYVCECQLIACIYNKCQDCFFFFFLDGGILNLKWLFFMRNDLQFIKNIWEYRMKRKKKPVQIWSFDGTVIILAGKIWILGGRHFEIVMKRKCHFSQKYTKLFLCNLTPIQVMKQTESNKSNKIIKLIVFILCLLSRL
jgi:hypothetical protein